MHLFPFLAVSALVVVTPGVDMALVTKNALLHGRSAAQATAVGINLGILVWTLAAALGPARCRRSHRARDQQLEETADRHQRTAGKSTSGKTAEAVARAALAARGVKAGRIRTPVAPVEIGPLW